MLDLWNRKEAQLTYFFAIYMLLSFLLLKDRFTLIHALHLVRLSLPFQQGIVQLYLHQSQTSSN